MTCAMLTSRLKLHFGVYETYLGGFGAQPWHFLSQ
jgi:hypothetical protein